MLQLKKLVHEIHRRSLWQILGIYVAVSWLVLQVVDTLAAALNLPDWAPSLALFLLIIGFPLVLATAFIQEGIGARKDPELFAAEGPNSAEVATSGRERPAVPRRLFTWRNAVLGLVFAFAVWGVVAAGWLLLEGRDAGGTEGPLVPASPTRIAVFPFAVRGSQDFAYLAEGLVGLLSTKLDGAGELRSVDPRAVLSTVARESGALDPRRVRALAERHGAGSYVVGELLEAGGRFEITAALFYQSQGPDPVARASVEGTTAELFDLVDDLSAQLLRSSGGPNARVRQIAAVTTTSLPALKSYLQGQGAFRAGEFDVSVEAFQRAIAADSSFALAYYRLSIAAEWLGRTDLSYEAARAAYRHAGRLSDRDRRLLEAFLAWRRGDARRAEDLYRGHVGAYPDDVEGWFQLGEVLFHANALRGRSGMEAQTAFENVLALEPDHSASVVHLARIAAAQRRLEELDSLAQAVVEANPEGDRAFEMLALRAFSRRNEVLENGIASRLERTSDLTVIMAAWSVALFTDNLAGAERLARIVAAPSRPPELRSLGHAWLAHFRLARGHWRAAGEELASVEDSDPVLALEVRAALAGYGLWPIDRGELMELRVALEGMDAESVLSSSSPNVFFSAHNGLHPALRAYLLGLLSVRLGDATNARDYATQLEAMSPPSGAEALTSDLARGVRALALRSEGRVAEALAELEETRIEVRAEQAMASPFLSQDFQRFLRAELLREARMPREALEWYRHLVGTSPWEFGFLPFVVFGQGQTYEALGDLEKAVEHYAQFVELWADADEALQPRVRAAQQRLEEIVAARG